jgi:hypothetical protein
MNLSNNSSSTTNFSPTSMSPRRSAASARRQRSLPSMERMTLDLLLQPRKQHNQPGDDEDSGGEAVRGRLCSYLQQALDLVDAITVEDEHGGIQRSDLAVCLSPGTQRINIISDPTYL